ncbi:3'(2'),5'-bisphosphate nucleotidase [Thioalkalivibrio sp. K90mix]|uniref:3'(2'),5'-bisphosphate nucleotidase CysQ n=1 Tax=unclassified Thioalkalivibrio TaxID=2621013 RepID=UPI000195931A|nr:MULTISPECIES: 3'(2'),5'-bisphosphate nucleotidase CysQ [unclassified Thioalkalivibrio]ADC72907.1 3'(2'),5'-bisphosphate nucleotidase [Thioalkalivibrio sp. K90mix]
MNEPPKDAALTALMQEVGGLAEDAGHAILEVYETRFAVTEKDDRSPLTEADLAAHRVIAQGLREIAPEWPVLSEEGQDVPFERRKQWRTYWLIDPLDGTREFVKRTGEFTVNIALIHDHEPLMGVVWSPVLQRLYAGHAGGGAIRRDGSEVPRSIEVARDRIDTEHPLVAGSRSHGAERLKAVLERLGPHELVSLGSSMKLCMVAEGAADIYPRLGPTSEWDTAAAHAVVRAAGGHVTDLHGQELRYNTKESMLNPEFLVCAGDPARWLRRLGLPDA